MSIDTEYGHTLMLRTPILLLSFAFFIFSCLRVAAADEGWVLWEKTALTKYSGDKLVEESITWDIEGGYSTFELCFVIIKQKVDTALQLFAKGKDQFKKSEIN